MDEFKPRVRPQLVWMPWQRPGFELALMMRRVVDQIPAAMGLCWAGTDCLPGRDTARMLPEHADGDDQLGQFIERHGEVRSLWRKALPARADRGVWRSGLQPFLPTHQRTAALYFKLQRSAGRAAVCRLSERERAGVSPAPACPDHFIPPRFGRFLCRGCGRDLEALEAVDRLLACAVPASSIGRIIGRSPRRSLPMRDASPPSFDFRPGNGSVTERTDRSAHYRRILYDAIHVMEGATLLSEGEVSGPVPSASQEWIRRALKSQQLRGVACARGVPHRYWALKRRRFAASPGEGIEPARGAGGGGASGIGREVAHLAAKRGACICCDATLRARPRLPTLASVTRGIYWQRNVDVRSRKSIRR